MKKFVNFKFVVMFALALVANVASYAQDNVIDEVVWVVGDEAILKSDVEEARLAALYEGRKFDGDPYCVIPEELAVQKLYMHQAVLDSIEVPESEVIQRVDYQINNYIQALGSRERMEADFKDLPQDSIPYVPTQVEVQIITQQPKVPISEIEDVKRRLREYTDRINKGESDFSTLALLYSEDRGSAIKGGETGFMGKGQMVPEYANVAFNLQDTKKISKIVESEYGFHIIQLIEKRGDRINTRHILLKPKVSDKELNEANARLDSIANDIRSDKFTFDQAAAALSQDKDTRNNHGLMQNPMNQTAKFEMQDLPQEIAKVVDKMNIGEISKAFTMVNPKDGKEVCAIVKLKARINGHKATITDDYQNLKEIVLDKRREEALQKWIVEKQKHTYVRINPAWQRCDFKYPGWIKKD